MSNILKAAWEAYCEAAASIGSDDGGADLYDVEGMNEAARGVYQAALAMLAAEREACADVADKAAPYSEEAILNSKTEAVFNNIISVGCSRKAREISACVRARTPDDEKAALDALLKAERVKALREAANKAAARCNARNQFDLAQAVRDTILALIGEGH